MHSRCKRILSCLQKPFLIFLRYNLPRSAFRTETLIAPDHPLVVDILLWTTTTDVALHHHLPPVVTAPALTIANVLRPLFVVIIMIVMVMDVAHRHALALMTILHHAVPMMTLMTPVHHHRRHHLATTMTPTWRGDRMVVLALLLGVITVVMIAAPTGREAPAFP